MKGNKKATGKKINKKTHEIIFKIIYKYLPGNAHFLYRKIIDKGLFKISYVCFRNHLILLSKERKIRRIKLGANEVFFKNE